jgi:hypothetical protein
MRAAGFAAADTRPIERFDDSQSTARRTAVERHD